MADRPTARGASPIPIHVREHVALMTRALIVVGGLGGIGGIAGGIQLLAGVHGKGPLFWIAGGLALVVLSQIWAVQRAIKERDAASLAARSIKQEMFSVAEGASVTGSVDVSHNLMSLGPSATQATQMRAPRRRWWPRVLEEEQRIDLADRCEGCSVEMLEWLHRPRSQPDPALNSHERWDEEQRLREQHEAETKRIVESHFSARVRDLLNECAEAGYSLNAAMEYVRVEGDIRWDNRQSVAEDLGIVGRRVRRRSKRL